MNQLPLAFTYGLYVLCINKIKKLLFQVFMFEPDYNSVFNTHLKGLMNLMFQFLKITSYLYSRKKRDQRLTSLDNRKVQIIEVRLHKP